MTLSEAISREERKTTELRDLSERYARHTDRFYRGMSEALRRESNEHDQLATWLRELRRYRDADSVVEVEDGTSDRSCINCRRNIRMIGADGVSCTCLTDGHSIDPAEAQDQRCRRWAKEKR